MFESLPFPALLLPGDFAGLIASALAATGAAVDAGALLRSIASGFRHIVPEGLDHIAFVLGLFFLARRFQTLLMHVTLFTVAHSLTMGLAVLHGMTVPAMSVEIAVGVTIAALAIEGMFPGLLNRWLQASCIFVFGCIHGLAFAHHLASTDDILHTPVAALFGFNLGVEAGQLLVVGVAFAAAAPWWGKSWYRVRIARPALSVIAASGLVWVFQRLG